MPEIQDRYRSFFLAELTSKTEVDGVWRYAWAEQSFNNQTGVPTTANPGRTGTATVTPALEANNAAIDLPVYAYLKQKGIVAGQAYYEFVAPGVGGDGGSGSGGEGEEEFKDECLNGYLIRKKAILTHTAGGISQTEYVFDHSFGTRCETESGSGGTGGGGSGSGNGGDNLQQRLPVVTNVCPTIDPETGYLTGITVEKSLILLPPGSLVVPRECSENPDDCCSGSGPDCCGDEPPLETGVWAVFGPFGENGENTVMDGVFSREGSTGLFYTSPDRAMLGDAFATFTMFCEEGTGWVAYGTVLVPVLAENEPIYYRIPLEDIGDMLVGDILLPDGGTVTLGAEKPCGGSGSGGSGSGGSCDPLAPPNVLMFSGMVCSGCPVNPLTLTRNPSGPNGDRWYSPTQTCSGKSLYFSFYLPNPLDPGNYAIVEHLDGIQYGTGVGQAQCVLGVFTWSPPANSWPTDLIVCAPNPTVTVTG